MFLYRVSVNTDNYFIVYSSARTWERHTWENVIHRFQLKLGFVWFHLPYIHLTLTCREPSQFNQFPCFSIPAALINLRTSLCTSLHLPLTDAVLHLFCWCDMKSLRPNFSLYVLIGTQLHWRFPCQPFPPWYYFYSISSLLSCNIRCCHTFSTLNSSVMDLSGLIVTQNYILLD